MTFTLKTSLISASFLAALLLLGLAPQGASAAVSPNAFLGGGNAFSRATSGQSQGLTNASPASGMLSRLSFASTRGGQPANVPPENDEQSNSGGNTAGGETGTDGEAGAEGVVAPPTSSGGNNGGVQAGNGGNGADGGNGGTAAAGGLVRAGDVVSNATALNMINTNIIRISGR